jgi:hypothetical protein
MTGDRALVLFSGGQDSATCLAWALDRFDRVETIGFDYGQRHRVELELRGGFRAFIAGTAWARGSARTTCWRSTRWVRSARHR